MVHPKIGGLGHVRRATARGGTLHLHSPVSAALGCAPCVSAEPMEGGSTDPPPGGQAGSPPPR
eukprot:8788179-Pyramimonas_sp.AAC.1